MKIILLIVLVALVFCFSLDKLKTFCKDNKCYNALEYIKKPTLLLGHNGCDMSLCKKTIIKCSENCKQKDVCVDCLEKIYVDCQECAKRSLKN